MSKFWSVNVATEEEIHFFIDRVEALLEAKGIKVDHPAFREVLKKAGARESAKGYITFPRQLQREFLALAPKSFLLGGMTPEYDLQIPHPGGLFYARGPIGQVYYHDALTGVIRTNTMADQEDTIMVQQGLEHMSMWGNFSVLPEGFPEEASDVHTAALCMRHCKKPAYWMPYSAHSVKYVSEMAIVIAGGREALKQRPFLTLMACSKPPEVVGQAIMAQIAGPGTPVLLSAFTYASDMRTMHALIAPIEMAKARLLASAVITRGYDLPCHAFCGGTDSHVLDAQAVAEEAYMTQLMAMSGAAIIGDLGALETCMIASPLLMIIANDLVAMAAKLREGLVLDDESLGYQELLDVNEDGVFLDLEHTYNHFREICDPQTFNRAPRELWEKEGGKDLIARARDEYRTLKSKHQPVSHPQEVLKEMDAIAARASKELAV